MNLNFSNDLGNGTLKGIINNKYVKIPSSIVVQRPQDIHDPITYDSDAGRKQFQNYIESYMSHMDVSIQSPKVKLAGQFLVGDSAVSSGLATRDFDVSDMTGKSETDLALILTLSTIAGAAIESFYNQKKRLPKKSITVNVNMVTALPIMEGLRNRTADYYKQRYVAADHVVSIRNFDHIIEVHIHFNKDKTHVLLEGQTAIYAIKFSNNKELENDIYKDFSANYPAMAKDIDGPQEIINQKGVLGVDVGEGTTDLAVFNPDGTVNKNASRSIPWGFGHVINSAINNLQERHFGVTSRSQIKKILQTPTNAFTKSRKQMVEQAIRDCEPDLINKITNAVSMALRQAGTGTTVIYVYGGGAIPMADDLRKPLEIKTTSFSAGTGIPVIFINKKFAQEMNVLGLNVVLNSIINNK